MPALDQLAIMLKALFAGAIIVVAISSIYVYRVWLKDTSRRVKISIVGFTIELGEATDSETEENKIVIHHPPIKK